MNSNSRALERLHVEHLDSSWEHGRTGESVDDHMTPFVRREHTSTALHSIDETCSHPRFSHALREY